MKSVLPQVILIGLKEADCRSFSACSRPNHSSRWRRLTFTAAEHTVLKRVLCLPGEALPKSPRGPCRAPYVPIWSAMLSSLLCQLGVDLPLPPVSDCVFCLSMEAGDLRLIPNLFSPKHKADHHFKYTYISHEWKKKSTFKKPVSNNRPNQCMAQMLEGFIMLYHFIFVVALQTHLSALMIKITIYINLLSILDQEQLVTMLQLKKKQIKTSRKKIISFYLHRCLHEEVTRPLHGCRKLTTVSKM